MLKIARNSKNSSPIMSIGFYCDRLAGSGTLRKFVFKITYDTNGSTIESPDRKESWRLSPPRDFLSYSSSVCLSPGCCVPPLNF